MTELDQALANITAIRQQMARGTLFRGYGPAALATSGLLAMGAALAQHAWLPQPLQEIGTYLSLWVAVALASTVLIAITVIATIIAMKLQAPEKSGH